MYMYVYVCVCVCMCMHVYICVCMCMYVYVCISRRAERSEACPPFTQGQTLLKNMPERTRRNETRDMASSPHRSQEVSGWPFSAFLSSARQMALRRPLDAHFEYFWAPLANSLSKMLLEAHFTVCLGPARQITLRMLLDAHSEEQS